MVCGLWFVVVVVVGQKLWRLHVSLGRRGATAAWSEWLKLSRSRVVLCRALCRTRVYPLRLVLLLALLFFYG